MPTAVDSRIIFNQGGAELLRGAGDLLALENSIGGPPRLQAPLVEDCEIDRVCDWFASRPPRHISSSRECLEHRGRQSVPWLLLDDVSVPASSPVVVERVDSDCGNISAFACVALGRGTVAEAIDKQYPQREYRINLIYVPFLFGAVRRGLGKSRIMFEPDKGFFVVDACPLRIVPFWERTEGLRDEAPVLRELIKRKYPAKPDILRNAPGARGARADIAQCLRSLVERGLVSRSRRGYVVVSELRL